MEHTKNNTIALDLHVHTKLSRSIPFNMADLHKLITHGKSIGLDGFAITEHINAPDYWQTYEQIGQRFFCDSGIYYVEPGFHLVNGAEITLKGKGDILALGDIRSIQALDLKLNLSGGYHPTLEEFVQESPADLILIGAHPYRPKGGIMKFETDWLRKLTAIEVNGKDFGQEDKVENTAAYLELPIVGGSDTHYWPQLGIRRTLLPITRLTIYSIKNAIMSRRSTVQSNPDGPFLVDVCTHHKRTLKAALGLYSPERLAELDMDREVTGERKDRIRVF